MKTDREKSKKMGRRVKREAEDRWENEMAGQEAGEGRKCTKAEERGGETRRQEAQAE